MKTTLHNATRTAVAIGLLAAQTWCWCGADGPPRPPEPEAKPPVDAPADSAQDGS